ncbi:MAG: hypothetical protein M3071_05140 [Actinomycetota bacterium]|nr:hypothetical protein [Actinomycetota bacterium]
MRAVWSYWSRPYAEAQGWQWREPLHHFLAWGLSFELARRHFPETALVTDSAGKALLVDQLGLPFDHVSTELDGLDGADPGLWALGKLLAFSVQEAPFVHLDTDVFLWRPLPIRLTTAPVLGQHPENFHVADEWSGARVIEDAFTDAGIRVRVPAEWEWARSLWGRTLNQVNCGIVGGTNIDFIRYYARLALDLVLNRRHAAAWKQIPDKRWLNTVIEQFTLAACAEFHRFAPESPFRGVHVRYLFPSTEAAFDRRYAERCGFTHLLAEAKGDPRVTERLERRMELQNHELYQRCVAVSAAAWAPDG